jgi:hypothetical protein
MYLSRHKRGNSKNKLKPAFRRSALVTTDFKAESETLLCLESHITLPQIELPSDSNWAWFLTLKIKMKNLPDYVNEMEVIVNKT